MASIVLARFVLRYRYLVSENHNIQVVIIYLEIVVRFLIPIRLSNEEPV